jgi:2',3'-cyclic-nucleotide 2'-phosphodiesterase/3'-nucleotidase
LRKLSSVLSVILAVLLVMSALILPPVPAIAQTSSSYSMSTDPQLTVTETKAIRLLETSDIHGQIDNWNYFTDAAYSGSSMCGMTRIASYANQVRAANPNTLLIDNGDTTQGTPVNYLYNILTPSVPNPISVAMNYMGYTSMTLGNHEFNFGLGVLDKIGGEMTFPELSANIRKTSDNSNAFTPYIIKDVGGVKVGILGLSPQAIPHWEKPENIAGLKFTDPIVEANHFVPLMKADGANVIVIAAHSGWDPTFGYGPEENFLQGLANQVPGVDVIMGGHDHSNRITTLNNVLITVPKNGATQVMDTTITLSGSGSTWTVVSKTAVTANMSTIPEDPGLVTLLQPYHDATRTYINTPIGYATAAFPGGAIARFKDGPTADLINLVQTEAAAAAGFPVDVSCAALFNDAAALPAGPIKLKDAYALYIYDNTLYVVQCTGAEEYPRVDSGVLRHLHLQPQRSHLHLRLPCLQLRHVERYRL